MGSKADIIFAKIRGSRLILPSVRALWISFWAHMIGVQVDSCGVIWSTLTSRMTL